MERKLSRKKSHRELMLRNLATSLILYEKIQTTVAKAKTVKPLVEKMLTRAKKDDLIGRRLMLGFFLDKMAVAKIFEKLTPRYKDIQSGFIKSYKLAPRPGDNAPMTMLKLMPEKENNQEIKNETKSK